MKNFEKYFFLFLLSSATFLFFWMLGSYLYPIFWAIVIATVFFPIYQKIESKFKKRKSIASFLAIGSVVVLLVLPVGLITGLVVNESISVYQMVTNNISNTNQISLFESFEKILAYIEPYGISKDAILDRAKVIVASAAQIIATSLISFTGSTVNFVIYTAISFYLLFFLFRDAEKIKKTVMSHFPLDEKYEVQLLQRFTETTRAVLKGTIAIACLQGVLGGIAFWIAGVSNPALWGLVMGMLAIIPAVGPMLVWLPTGITLIVTGEVFSGVFVLIVGAALVSLVDEFLRPVLVGRASKMHDAITLLATIGGLSTFGISGIIVGPVIAAFFISLWAIFKELFKDKKVT